MSPIFGLIMASDDSEIAVHSYWFSQHSRSSRHCKIMLANQRSRWWSFSKAPQPGWHITTRNPFPRAAKTHLQGASGGVSASLIVLRYVCWPFGIAAPASC